MKKWISALVGLSLSILAVMPAHAVQFAASTAPGATGSPIFPFKVGSPIIGPLGVEFSMRIMPSLSALLGPTSLTLGQSENSSMLFDGNLDLSYGFKLAEWDFLGKITPTLSPYLGFRYLGAPTVMSNLDPFGQNMGISSGYSQYSGLNYGLRFNSDLPLGFSTYAYAGATTLLSGGWDYRSNSVTVSNAGQISTGGATLPAFGVGANWSFFNIFGLYAGYDLLILPTHMRSFDMALSGDRATINSFSVGLKVLMFSL